MLKHAEPSFWRIEVTPRSSALDARGREVLADIHRAGFPHVCSVRSSRLFLIETQAQPQTLDTAARALLADAVAETVTCAPDTPEIGPAAEPSVAVIEVHYQPGVMDPVALSARRALDQQLAAPPNSGSPRVDSVRTAWRYLLEGVRDGAELDRIAHAVLANDCIENVYLHGFDRREHRAVAPAAPPQRPFEVRTVALRDLDGSGLERLSRSAHLFLSRAEMEAIRDHFRTLRRDPTDLELETLAQTWSEHCVHKTLRSDILYRGDGFGRDGTVEVRIDNLLKSTIVAATRALHRDWCWSVFEDNAGVIAFDERFGIAFKVETHNHPSAIEPYGGAATGIGGCIRDIMGCGLAAKPIASTDVFCVAPPDYPRDRLPRGVLHPARVLKGIVGGVRDYGNRMGIPTVNGAVFFDPRYLANPLVFCGSIGLIPRDRIAKQPHPGDHIVVLGGRTGRDGIHGATFSSAELTENHADEFSHAVQIGNAIEQKKVLDAMLQARNHTSGCLYSAVTDCGAGGLSSAVGEMASGLGAVVDLEHVPLKYAGLRYDEIWISEAQERMVVAVPPDRLATLLALCAAEDVETSIIGTFADNGRLVVRYAGTVVGDLDLGFLHDGLPRTTREATWSAATSARPKSAVSLPVAGTVSHLAPSPGGAKERTTPSGADWSRILLARLADFNVASKEWVVGQYDHEVQGGSVLKPLCGPGHGPSDAAVLRPLLDRWRGIAVACGLCPQLSDRDPYWMAVCAVDEALRNVLCVGADPARIAILDNFCWGGCRTPEALGELVRACRGAHDAAVAFGLPFISGKDSLNNQFSQDPAEARRLGLPATLTIPGTLLISALGIVEDTRRCITMDFKQPGHPLVLVAAPADRAGLGPAAQVHAAVSREIRAGTIAAAHDLSDGGLAVTLAEMCLAGNTGAQLDLTPVVGDDSAAKLFGEYPTAYVLECIDAGAAQRLNGVPLGEVTQEPRLQITVAGEPIIDLEASALASAWRTPLARMMSGATG